MKVGNLVRLKKDAFSASDPNRLGVVIDFHSRVDRYAEPQERYAVVNWGPDFPEEEEYPDQLEIIQ